MGSERVPPQRLPEFRPLWWLANGHLQTVWPTLFRRTPEIEFSRERLELGDGDFVDLDWTTASHPRTVIILHGLQGSSDSKYVRGLCQRFALMGWRAVVLHFRGCSGEPNRLDRSYHSGDTADLNALYALVRRRYPRDEVFLVGYSLGGNVALKWLAESGDTAGIRAACAVSVPFLLGDCARKLESGMSRLYQSWLMSSMRRSATTKFAERPCPVSLERVRRSRTFYEFDDAFTAPLNGFADAEDYYSASSCRQYLARIRARTLIIHAGDDPFTHASTTPLEAELSDSTEMIVTRSGGHVGFVGRKGLLRPHYWLEETIPRFFEDTLGR